MQKKNTVLWPLGENEPANLFEDPNYQISLSVNKSSVVVASNSTQLPIYMRQYTKCCGYKVRGNKKYSLIARQNKDSTDFLLQVLGQTPKVAKVAFSKSDGIITTECNFDADIIGVNGLITLNGQSSPLTEPLTNGKVFDNRCSWTLPGVVKYNSGKLDTKKGSFNLKIFVDETPVYNEDNVNLSGFAFTTSASFIVIMMSVMISFIFL
uniref:Uncharacterized protein n=1 Tax=Tetranychus urticae TaxID=32264 RepID=T1KTW7_TETUR